MGGFGFVWVGNWRVWVGLQGIGKFKLIWLGFVKLLADVLVE